MELEMLESDDNPMGRITPQKDVAIFPPGTGRRGRQQIGVQSPDIVLVGLHPLRSLHSAR